MRVPLLFIALLLIGLRWTAFGQTAKDTMLYRLVPDVTLVTLEGKTVSLRALEGKVIVINLFFKQCHYCRQEEPLLNKIFDAYADTDVVFLAISSINDARELSRYLTYCPFKFQMVPCRSKYTPRDWRVPTNLPMIKQQFGTDAFPTDLIVDRHGCIVYYEQGFENTAEFIDAFTGSLCNAIGDD